MSSTAQPIPGKLYRLKIRDGLLEYEKRRVLSTVFGISWEGDITVTCENILMRSYQDHRYYSNGFGGRCCLDTREIFMVMDSAIYGSGNTELCFKVWYQNKFVFIFINKLHYELVEATDEDMESGNYRFPNFNDNNWLRR